MIGRKVLNNRQKGITLISLVITILVLIILATVSIATITGDNGILSRATKTAKMANDTEAREQVEVSVLRSFDERGEIDLDELNKNLSKIPGLKYNGKSLGSGNKIDKLPVTLEVDGYEITIDEEGNVLGTLLAGQTSQLTQKDNYKDESGDTATIPKGFTVSDTDNTVDTGLVVTDSKGNEFVWVPVPDISTMATFDGSNYHDKNNREPIWQSVDTDNIGGDPNVNLETVQTRYNNMIESVDKYKGFYVGRYEMSFNALSKKGETSISSFDYRPEWVHKAWYGLFGLFRSSLRPTDDSVFSDMMYAGQYDWMMNWMKENGVNTLSSTPVPGASPNKEHINGSTESDKINNVYDLLGNRKYEWTQGVNGTHRIFTNSGALADTHMYDPMTESEDLGTRVTLYIRDDSASNIQDYIGYYADVNGDGNVDGIIYNDLAKSSASGTFKKYTVGQQQVGGFGTWKKPMISLVKGSSGNDRFKVMALEDVNYGGDTSWYWYAGAAGNSAYADAIGKLTSDQKNSGKYMTTFMTDAWNFNRYEW